MSQDDGVILGKRPRGSRYHDGLRGRHAAGTQGLGERGQGARGELRGTPWAGEGSVSEP
jgi:hypothetical protein